MEPPNCGDYSPTEWYQYLRGRDTLMSDGDLITQVFGPVFPTYATQPPIPVTPPDDQLPQEIPPESTPAHTPDVLDSLPGSVGPDNTLDALNSPPCAIALERLDDRELEVWTTPPASIATPSPTRTFLPPEWYQIPQTIYDFGTKQYDFEQSERILFHVDGYPGQNMGDALRDRFPGLLGRDDPVLQEASGAISCRLYFPGYPPNKKAMQICTTYYNKNHDPIKRSKLAHDVAKRLEQYLDLMRSSQMIDAATDTRWKIGEGFMHLDNMYLSELESVSKGSFQPMIWVRVMDPGAQNN